METQEPRTGQGPPSRRERGPGVVEFVREKLEEVAAEAEWALGSEEGLKREWVGGSSAEEEEGEGEEEGFFEGVARAIEQTLWSDEPDEGPEGAKPPDRRP